MDDFNGGAGHQPTGRDIFVVGNRESDDTM